MKKPSAAMSALQNHPKKRSIIVLAVLGLLILIFGCISIVIQGNMQAKYTAAVRTMQEKVYQGMMEMTQTYAYVNDPSVDVQNKLIPELKSEYAAVKAVNSCLKEGFGASSCVLDENLVSRLENAFTQFASAYRSMSPTGLAAANMKACIDDLQAMIDERYADHSEQPVVIQAN